MGLPIRYHMIGLLFCGSAINYVDRVNISVAAPVMMKEMDLSKDLFGWIFSAFLIGYALLQLPGGVIADRWSGRKVLALAACGFSLFTLLTPLGTQAFFLLLIMRFLVGAFESMTFPATASINSRWIPRSEFGRAHNFSISGITVGQMIAYPLTTWIILQSSWQTVFYINAVFGFVWAAIWWWYATDTPAAHPRMSEAERSYIQANLPPRTTAPQLPIRALFSSLSLLTVAFGYMCFAYVGWLFLFWFPTYLVEARGLSAQQHGNGRCFSARRRFYRSRGRRLFRRLVAPTRLEPAIRPRPHGRHQPAALFALPAGRGSRSFPNLVCHLPGHLLYAVRQRPLRLLDCGD